MGNWWKIIRSGILQDILEFWYKSLDNNRFCNLRDKWNIKIWSLVLWILQYLKLIGSYLMFAGFLWYFWWAWWCKSCWICSTKFEKQHLRWSGEKRWRWNWRVSKTRLLEHGFWFSKGGSPRWIMLCDSFDPEWQTCCVKCWWLSRCYEQRGNGQGPHFWSSAFERGWKEQNWKAGKKMMVCLFFLPPWNLKNEIQLLKGSLSESWLMDFYLFIFL